MTENLLTLTPEGSGSYAERLLRDGVVVLPFLSEAALAKSRIEGMKTCNTFPEYKHPSAGTQYVLRGFGAFGNPASFHNVWIREFRKQLREFLCKHLFLPLIKLTGVSAWRLEMLFDRILERHVGQSATAESWHRDISPTRGLIPGDVCFGGWVNLDSTKQTFSCIYGTHRPESFWENHAPHPYGELPKKFWNFEWLSDIKSGFNTVTDRDPAEKIRLMAILKGLRPSPTQIPPGHCIVFFQHLLHEVVATAAVHQMLRVFHGYRLTQSQDGLFQKFYAEQRLFERFVVPPLPSGQQPPMYSANHASVFLGLQKNEKPVKTFRHAISGVPTTLIKWSSNTFGKECLITKKRKCDDKPYQVVSRQMPSLQELREMAPPNRRLGYDEWLRSNPPYSEEERRLYTPQLL